MELDPVDLALRVDALPEPSARPRRFLRQPRSETKWTRRTTPTDAAAGLLAAPIPGSLRRVPEQVEPRVEVASNKALAAGWYPDSEVPGSLRWWDGVQWTEERAVQAPSATSARSERVWAAVSHLGVPFWSLILPTVVWSVSPVGSFRRLHARQAFSYQLVYLPFHLFFTAVMLWGPGGPLLICMLVGLILELPQIARAMMRKKPYPLPPFQLLKP